MDWTQPNSVALRIYLRRCFSQKTENVSLHCIRISLRFTSEYSECLSLLNITSSYYLAIAQLMCKLSLVEDILCGSTCGYGYPLQGKKSSKFLQKRHKMVMLYLWSIMQYIVSTDCQLCAMPVFSGQRLIHQRHPLNSAKLQKQRRKMFSSGAIFWFVSRLACPGCTRYTPAPLPNV